MCGGALYCTVCVALYCTAVCCIVLQCVALYCAVCVALYCTAVCCIVLCCVCCIVLYCSVLHCTVLCVLHCTMLCVLHCSVLQRVALYSAARVEFVLCCAVVYRTAQYVREFQNFFRSNDRAPILPPSLSLFLHTLSLSLAVLYFTVQFFRFGIWRCYPVLCP
jgi:hypothetical protein